ncbi:MAG: DUF5694 domain-containing protein [Maricaulaceae bacterium]
MITTRKSRAQAVVLAALALALTVPAFAQTYAPSFQPSQMTDEPPGPKNEVAVLATPHLSNMSDEFRPEMVGPLVDRLAAWRPSAIAVETIPGLVCDAMRRAPVRYGDGRVELYCFDPSHAGEVSGLDVSAANAAAEEMLAAWPESPAPKDRRRLALLFLAAGEPGSALVQWLRLPPEERVAANGLDKTLTADIEARRTRWSEVSLIAAPVAARVGLERLWSVDDQAYYAGTVDRDAYGQALSEAWDNPTTARRRAKDKALRSRLGEDGGFMDLYRALNAPDYPDLAYRSDWGAALVEPSEPQYGRRYVAYWETRNLRMVANMREVLGRAPGTRMLSIVGASHKGYYEAYLDEMRDVDLVDILPLLE